MACQESGRKHSWALRFDKPWCMQRMALKGSVHQQTDMRC